MCAGQMSIASNRLTTRMCLSGNWLLKLQLSGKMLVASRDLSVKRLVAQGLGLGVNSHHWLSEVECGCRVLKVQWHKCWLKPKPGDTSKLGLGAQHSSHKAEAPAPQKRGGAARCAFEFAAARRRAAIAIGSSVVV